MRESNQNVASLFPTDAIPSLIQVKARPGNGIGNLATVLNRAVPMGLLPFICTRLVGECSPCENQKQKGIEPSPERKSPLLHNETDNLLVV